MRRIRRGQRGFTLIELLIAVPLVALIVAAATGAIIQLISATHDANHMVALRQVQTAGFWVEKDGIQAQNVSLGGSRGFPLNITWIDWETEVAHNVTYSIVSSGSSMELQRSEKIGGNTTKTTIAQFIDSGNTSCNWASAGEKTFTLNVTAQVGQQRASGTYKVEPRPFL